MRIVIDNGNYDLLNLGDIAMLQAAVSRFRAKWPDAEIHVITRSAKRLEQFVPGTLPFDDAPRGEWLKEQLVPWKLQRVSRRLFDAGLAFETKLRYRRPGCWHRLLKVRSGSSRTNGAAYESFLQFMDAADIVVASGCGIVNDMFPPHVYGVLATLGLAQGLGRVTAMFGQGLGPLSDRNVRRLAATVMPGLNLLTLREGVASRPLAEELGAVADRVVVTGDDAVEVAYEFGQVDSGNCLGVNVRVADYSEMQPQHAKLIGACLGRAITERGTSAVPVPISLHPKEDDFSRVRQLFNGSVDLEGHQVTSVGDIMTNLDLCRMVVTGSYHAAVFALSRGIPVVGLARSQYYVEKFEGLRGQFGEGCQMVDPGSSDFEETMTEAIRNAWDSPAELKRRLRSAAERQIELVHGAYDRFEEMVESAIARS